MKNPTTETTPRLSAREFLALGMAGIAYIKPRQVEGAQHFAIHTADGAEVALAESWEDALATVRANDLEPVSLH
jgi:hypothetical protein